MGRPSLTEDQKFWARIVVDPKTECWEWQGRTIKGGYGQLSDYGKNVMAHRWSYEQFVGLIEQLFTVDHLCTNPPCVNPSHLEAVTQKVNNYRSPKYFGNRTHCPKGHEYNELNTYIMRNGWRDCRTCINERAKAYKEREMVKGTYLPRSKYCRRGHEYSGHNLYIVPSGGYTCRKCLMIRQRTYRAKRKLKDKKELV